MESYDRVTEQRPYVVTQAGIVSEPVMNTAERVIFTVHGNGNVQGDFRAPNASSFTKQTYYPPAGQTTANTFYNGGKLYSDTVSGQISGGRVHLAYSETPEWERLQDTNWEKIYGQIRGGNNLIVDLAESAATISMLRNANDVRTQMSEFFGRTVVPRRYKRWRERLDYLTSKWLEYRYGWMPLVYSTYDAFKTLAHKWVVDPDVWLKVRSSYAISNRDRTGNGSIDSPEVYVLYDASYRCETKVNLTLDLGLGIHDWTSLNPLGIAWELLPLSFVADWFVNVGQTLSLWENYWLYNSKFKSGYQTYSYKREQNVITRGSQSYPYSLWPNGDPMDYQTASRALYTQSRTIETYKNRQPMGAIPFPGGVRVDVNLNSKRILDAASLLQQLVVKRFR
jgi:hypothetical protein